MVPAAADSKVISLRYALLKNPPTSLRVTPEARHIDPGFGYSLYGFARPKTAQSSGSSATVTFSPVAAATHFAMPSMRATPPRQHDSGIQKISGKLRRCFGKGLGNRQHLLFIIG
jgi:hypothetical protein